MVITYRTYRFFVHHYCRLLWQRAALLIVLPVVLAFLPLSLQAKTAVEVYEEASKSVVTVYNYDRTGKRQSLGSGVVMPNAEIATNYHVIHKASTITVVYQGRDHTAKVKFADSTRDVCTLNVSGLLGTTTVVGNTKQLKIGSRVYAIGSPQGLEQTISEGIVSSFREIRGGRYIQSTAPISSGSSGGGLFNEEGQLVGLPTFFISAGQQLNFAVPVEWIAELTQRRSGMRVIAAQTSPGMLKDVIAMEVKKNWTGMLQKCQLWIKSQPKNSDAWHSLGIAQSKIGDYNQSITSFQKAVKINPASSDAWEGMGVSFAHSGQKNSALAAYRKAVKINSANDEAWYNLGIIYEKNGELTEALAAFRHAVTINPAYLSAWFNIGSTLQRSGNQAGAIDAFRKVTDINPDNAFAWHNLGIAYRETGNLINSIDAFEQALRINPKYDPSWTNLAITCGKAGQKARRFDAYRMAISINPSNADAWIGLGVAFGEDDQTARAFDAFEQALQINPENDQALFNLGHLYARKDDQQKVRDLYRRLSVVNPVLARSFSQKYLSIHSNAGI